MSYFNHILGVRGIEGAAGLADCLARRGRLPGPAGPVAWSGGAGCLARRGRLPGPAGPVAMFESWSGDKMYLCVCARVSALLPSNSNSR